MRIATNTIQNRIASGQWNRVGRKHYRHAAGAEVRYDCNAWLWKITGGGADGLGYERQWAACDEVERAARS